MPEKKAKIVQVKFDAPDSLREELQIRAAKEHRTQAEVLTDALSAYLDVKLTQPDEIEEFCDAIRKLRTKANKSSLDHRNLHIIGLLIGINYEVPGEK